MAGQIAILDPEINPMTVIATLNHIHTESGLCVKDRSGQCKAPKWRNADQPPADDVEAMNYWSRRVMDGDAETAGGSMDLDYAHDELVKAARGYLGLPPK